MKKSTKLGAVVCAMALAMGTALPVFAADEPVSTTTSNIAGDSTSGGSGQTTVNLKGVDTTKQIKATLPVAITVSAPKVGGALTCPSAGTYAITNESNFAIQVTNAVMKAVDNTKWEIVPNLTDSTPTGITKNQIGMKVAAELNADGSAKTWENIAAYTSDGKAKTANLKLSALAGNTTPTTIPLDLSGYAYPQDTTNGFGAASQQAASITWTIAEKKA